MSDAPAEQGTKKKSNRKKWILLLAATIVFGGAGAATKFLVKADAQAGAVATVMPKKDTVFVPLDQFTVNLADEGGERLAQIAITLEVVDDDAGSVLKARMPSVRNSILLLLSSKRADELLSLDGKKKLALQITEITGRELGWRPPEASAGAGAASAGAEAAAGAGPVAADVEQPDAPAAAKAAGDAQHAPSNPVEAVNFSHFIVQ